MISATVTLAMDKGHQSTLVYSYCSTRYISKSLLECPFLATTNVFWLHLAMIASAYDISKVFLLLYASKLFAL